MGDGKQSARRRGFASWRRDRRRSVDEFVPPPLGSLWTNLSPRAPTPTPTPLTTPVTTLSASRFSRSRFSRSRSRRPAACRFPAPPPAIASLARRRSSRFFAVAPLRHASHLKRVVESKGAEGGAQHLVCVRTPHSAHPHQSLEASPVTTLALSHPKPGFAIAARRFVALVALDHVPVLRVFVFVLREGLLVRVQ